MKNILKALIDNLKEIISDVDGDLSSKRVITFLGFFVMIVTWVCNLWFDMTVLDYIFNGFLYLVVVGLGVVATEKFTDATRKVKASIKDIKSINDKS